MKTPSPARPDLRWLALMFLATVPLASLYADDAALPPNLGRGMRRLVHWERDQPAGQSARERRSALVEHVRHKPVQPQVDKSGNVVVDVRLDGTVASAAVQTSLEALGSTILGEHAARQPDRRDGVLSATLPLGQAVAASKVAGVQSVLLAHKPHPRAGKVPGQGVPVLHADAVQAAGFTGAGITVGVISDSYDTVSPSAAADVASGDLPSGVVVLQDDDDPDYDTDEGRAMLQIVHDVAPGARLVFSTTGDTQTTFANAIHRLRTNATAPCDVMVDDIGFSDEPFFSDSIVSEAINDVVTSSTLPGKKAIYYSAAGNDGSASYTGTFTFVSDADARAGQAGGNNLKLDQVPRSLTAGGFHNFKGADQGRGLKIVQRLTVSDADAELDFQWDDPFDADKITADYNILVFDADGNYLDSRQVQQSGTDDNFSTGEAIEYAELPLVNNADTVYQIAITCARTRPAADGTVAKRLKYFAYTEGTVAGKYIRTGQPTLYGHSAALNADGVAAFDVHTPTIPEDFDSSGPVTIYFDANNNRLATPEVRLQPTISAVDGVNTTFFPQPADENDSDGDGYPNFYGTSAAAPHAAAVAALLLQAAGGSGSLSAVQMRNLLESTATDHDLDPSHSQVTLTTTDGQFTLTLSANGDGSNNSAFDQKFFQCTYTGPQGSSLLKLSIDIGLANEVFDPTVDNGYPFTVGQTTGFPKADVTYSLADDASGVTESALTVLFTPGAFVPGASVAFGIDRDDASSHMGGNSADVLAGSKVKAKFVRPDGSKIKATGVLTNQIGHGYSPDVGYGLINAQAALQALRGQ